MNILLFEVFKQNV